MDGFSSPLIFFLFVVSCSQDLLLSSYTRLFLAAYDPIRKQFPHYVSSQQLQWTQNNFELQLQEGGKAREGGRARRQRACLITYNANQNIFPLLISTQSVAFSCSDFTLHCVFVNQRNYTALAMQASALRRTPNFCCLNLTISYLIV
jgi:hypothetical protein